MQERRLPNLYQELADARAQLHHLRQVRDAVITWLDYAKNRGYTSDDIVAGVREIVVDDILSLSPADSPPKWQLLPTPLARLPLAVSGDASQAVSSIQECASTQLDEDCIQTQEVCPEPVSPVGLQDAIASGNSLHLPSSNPARYLPPDFVDQCLGEEFPPPSRSRSPPMSQARTRICLCRPGLSCTPVVTRPYTLPASCYPFLQCRPCRPAAQDQEAWEAQLRCRGARLSMSI